MTPSPSITVNGTTYLMSDLSDAARGQVDNIQLVDAEIMRFQRLIAIAQTARNAYVAALVAAVEGPQSQAAIAAAAPASS